ncbi:MAG: insulinase family protein [Bryobacterales bacterium]|nr:insulinase family protein [Bryobacterales bacterium]
MRKRLPLDRRLELRVSAEDLTAWQQQAASSRSSSVANWIRHILNQEVHSSLSAHRAADLDRLEAGSDIATRQVTLPNGLRLVLQEVAGLTHTGVALAVDCGSRDERRAEFGAANLLGRTLLHSSGSAFATLEEAGGDANVTTTPDCTLYSFTAPAHAARSTFERAARILSPSEFSPALLETEKQSSIRQLDLRRLRAEDLLADVLTERCWRDHSLGHTPAGEVSALAACTPESLRVFFDRHYGASRMVLSVWGDFSRWNPEQQAAELFSNLPAGGPSTPFAPARFRSFVDVAEWHGRHANLAIALAAPPLAAPYRWAFELWEPLLTQGMYSLLWQKLWSRRSEVLKLSCEYVAHREAGMFRIHTTSEESAVTWILDRVLTALEEIVLAPENLPAGRIHHAQSVRIARLPKTSDVREQAANLALTSLLFGEPRHTFEARTAIAATDARLLHRAFREMLRPQTGNLSVAIATPAETNAEQWRKLVQERVRRRSTSSEGLSYLDSPWTM